MFTNNIEYFKSKPVNIPKITILLDHGYHIDRLVKELGWLNGRMHGGHAVEYC